jgi:small subunit ribosomal protein S15Ae
MKLGYIGEFETVDNHSTGEITVNLTHKLIKCEVISPSIDVQVKDLKKWQINIPSHQCFFIVNLSSHHGP